MKITTGIDIIEVNRIEESIEKFGDKFLKEIFTDKEIKYCNSKKNKYQHYAARFAAKEAVFKAISKLLDNKYKIEWTEIEIIHGKNQKPIVNLLKTIKQIEQIDVSLSHIKEYATASCIAVLNEKED